MMDDDTLCVMALNARSLMPSTRLGPGSLGRLSLQDADVPGSGSTLAWTARRVLCLADTLEGWLAESCSRLGTFRALFGLAHKMPLSFISSDVSWQLWNKSVPTCPHQIYKLLLVLGGSRDSIIWSQCLSPKRLFLTSLSVSRVPANVVLGALGCSCKHSLVACYIACKCEGSFHDI